MLLSPILTVLRGLNRSDQRIGQLQGQEVRSGVVYSKAAVQNPSLTKLWMLPVGYIRRGHGAMRLRGNRTGTQAFDQKDISSFVRFCASIVSQIRNGNVR